MSDPRFASTSTSSQSAIIDEGLRKHMSKVYGLMAVAMVITGLVAYAVGTSQVLLQVIFGTPLKWVVMFAPLGVVFIFSARMHKMRYETAQLVFWIFSALVGLSISYIFAVYTGISIAQTFFTTAIAFAGLSIYGYTTKRNLSGMRSFLIMGVVGLIIASIINIFVASAAFQFAISLIGVLIFAGLTAYDTQNIKNTYLQLRASNGEEFAKKAGIMGALSLYLNFLNMFMFLLSFMGNRE
jgi:FtsH-binding integral membrane protein